jgi:hypothetical protein
MLDVRFIQAVENEDSIFRSIKNGLDMLNLDALECDSPLFLNAYYAWRHLDTAGKASLQDLAKVIRYKGPIFTEDDDA